MSGQPKKLRMEEGKADTATRSPPKKSRTTQTIPKKKKLKSEAEKVKEKAAKLRLGKAEITPEEVSRMTKAQKRELYAAAAARSAAHREVEQYKLTTWVEVQIRYRTVWVISPAGIPVPTQVPYEYKIFHTKLENRGLEVVIREELTEDQWQRYQIFQDTLGGRPYLFNGGLPPGGSDGSGAPGIDYTVPAEALTDSEFAAIYEEAKKYVGTPYVWGGSSPETGFDCSGYVCWVYNQNGYGVGRTTANGLWQKSQHISEAEAKPGDLVFFKGTYDTPGICHWWTITTPTIPMAAGSSSLRLSASRVRHSTWSLTVMPRDSRPSTS